MDNLRKDLCKIVRYCRDNTEDFRDTFMQGIKNIYSLDGVYFSGSKCLIVYVDRYGNDCNKIVSTEDVFYWMETKGGFVL